MSFLVRMVDRRVTSPNKREIAGSNPAGDESRRGRVAEVTYVTFRNSSSALSLSGLVNRRDTSLVDSRSVSRGRRRGLNSLKPLRRIFRPYSFYMSLVKAGVTSQEKKSPATRSATLFNTPVVFGSGTSIHEILPSLFVPRFNP